MRGVCGAYYAGSEFKKLHSKLGFQKLNTIFIRQVRFFDYIIALQSTKMLAQIADLRLCALMSLCPYVLETLCPALLCRVSPLRRVRNSISLERLGKKDIVNANLV